MTDLTVHRGLLVPLADLTKACEATAPLDKTASVDLGGLVLKKVFAMQSSIRSCLLSGLQNRYRFEAVSSLPRECMPPQSA